MRMWVASWAIALPLFSQGEGDFRSIYNGYNMALRGQYYTAVTAILPHDQILQYRDIPLAQRPMFFGMASRIPTSYEVEYTKVSKDGMKATMLIIATFAPGPPGQASEPQHPQPRAEMTLQFVQEKGIWRMRLPIYGPDPDQRASRRNLDIGSRGDYAALAGAEVNGVVLRLERQAAGTVYVIRKIDEEDAVFVPMSQVSGEFVPGTAMSFRATRHKSEKLKYWAESVKIAE